MSKVKIELDHAGIRRFLLSDDVMDICEERANAAASQLGAGYSVNTYRGRNRVNAEVTADTYAARKANLESNTILKALKARK